MGNRNGRLLDVWTRASSSRIRTPRTEVKASLEEPMSFQKKDSVRHTGLVIAATIGLLVMVLPKAPNAFGAPSQVGRAGAQKSTITIPQSRQTEHEEIHKALTDATRAPGRVGAAANEPRGGA